MNLEVKWKNAFRNAQKFKFASSWGKEQLLAQQTSFDLPTAFFIRIILNPANESILE